MKVKLNNGRFPEDGSVVVTLPIEIEEYDQVIRQLDRLGVGSACLRDCGFEALLEGPDVMNRLAGGKVNIEELDYLAKRLDSFTASELATYSALALKHDLTDMTDLINLCDCFQNALIVTDFSDMSRIGRSYTLAQNGGSIAVDDLEKINLVAVARNLLSGNTGTVTPYGVLYDEGFSLEHIYDEGMIPPFYYRQGLMDIQVITEKDPDNCPEFSLPMPNQQILRHLERIGYQNGDSYTIDVLGSELPNDLAETLKTQAEDVFSLNNTVSAVAALDASEYEKLAAVMRYTSAGTLSRIRQVAEKLDMFEYIPGAQDPDDVGREIILNSGHFEVDPNLEDYIDYESYGLDHLRCGEGEFSSFGYVGYTGDDRLFFEQEHQQQMGGLT